MSLIAKESAAACVQPLLQQYYNALSAISFQDFRTRYPTNSWFNSTFFPIVDDQGVKATLVLVFFAPYPIYIKNPGTDPTTVAHFKGGWTGAYDDYTPITFDSHKVMTNGPYYGINADYISKVIAGVGRPVSGFLTFLPQIGGVATIVDQSWEYSVLMCLMGAPTATYTGALNVDSTWKLTHLKQKAAAAADANLKFLVYGPQASNSDLFGYNQGSFPNSLPTVVSNPWEPLFFNDVLSAIAMQIALLDNFRTAVSNQSTEITSDIKQSVQQHLADPVETTNFIKRVMDVTFKDTPPGSISFTDPSWNAVYGVLNQALGALQDQASAVPPLVSADTFKNFHSLVDKIRKAHASSTLFMQAGPLNAALSTANRILNPTVRSYGVVHKTFDYTPVMILSEREGLHSGLGKPATLQNIPGKKGPDPLMSQAAKAINAQKRQTAIDMIRSAQAAKRPRQEPLTNVEL